MNNLLNPLRNTESYKTIVAKLQSGERKIQLKGLYGSSKAYLLSALANDLPATFLVILPSREEAEKFVQDLLTFLDADSTQEDIVSSAFKDVLLFPEWKVSDEKHAVSLNGGALPSKRLVADRMLCLDKLLQCQTLKDMPNIPNTPPTFFSIVVTSIKALMHKVLPKEIFQNSLLRLAIGDEIDLDGILETLVHSGYRNVSMVEMKGEFARRGDILDIYPLTYDDPVRIEFWGDEVDSIRLFDVASQRSIEKLNEVRILPVRELILTPEAIDNCLQKIGQLEMETTSPKFLQALRAVKEQLESQIDLDGLETYLPWFYPNLETLCDYLPEDTIVFVDEFYWIAREADKFWESIQKDYEKKCDLDQVVVEPDEAFEDSESIFEHLNEKQVIYSALSRHLSDTLPPPPRTQGVNRKIDAPIEMGMRSLPAHQGDFQRFWNEFREWQREGYLVNILCDNAKQVERMNYILEERRLDIGGISVEIGILNDGFISDELKLVMMSDDEIFGRQRQRRRRVKFREGAPISSYMDLKEGDYVVHVSHGIGIYRGVKHLDIDGRMQDFLMLQYAGSDVLYVPTYQINMVQKYIGGGDDVKLKMDRLGGVRWSQVKARVKKDVQKLAKELLELYAARQTLPGHPFSQNTPWRQEFEAAFPYEETPDQLKAIEETLADMERARPMDRLVCGDVGYGKTEVAMRAAFKAVMDGKQVAVLVPTTVLAQQHFLTFSERFEPFPVKVEMLSRFRTSKEIKRVLADLTDGRVDIVIGTHRLLSKDVKFHDLGLLVIDEEHRFGVRHKERIKQLRKQVDVLTLSATPIPRTMHLSLVGARDLSIINTPPENRLPIETYVMEFNPDVVRDA
ncbi:MAG: transcription-repair coupling factor, partial [Candidatus Poribacteria bacterium]